MAGEPKKATIEVLDGNPPVKKIAVLFNPTEYGIEYSSSYQETAPPGLSNPIIQFVNGNTQVLSMDLLFDTYTDGGGSDVTKRTRQLTDLLSIDRSLHAPPRVEFSWGVISFKAVIEKISERFTMFDQEGTPVRATLNVTFKQYKTITEQLEDPRTESADKTKRRVFESADSIWLMAAREYGEPKYWRLIAEHNRIDNPRVIEPGRVLVLPPLEDFRDAGAAS